MFWLLVFINIIYCLFSVALRHSVSFEKKLIASVNLLITKYPDELETVLTPIKQGLLGKMIGAVELPSIYLLSEMPDLAIASRLKVKEEGVEQCIQIGSFFKKEVLYGFIEELQEIGVYGRIVQKHNAPEINYWVIIPPEKSVQELNEKVKTNDSEEDMANSIVKKLQNQGYGSFRIMVGKYENGVSLGVFGQKTKADKLKESIEKVNSNSKVEIKEIKAQRSTLWVEISREENQILDQDWWQNMQSKYSGIKPVEKNCES